MGLSVGDQAPDFELDGTEGRFRLSDHRGERVVLLFYPGDFTPVCTKQFCSYAERAEDMSALDATVVGISAQDVDSHSKFVNENGIPVRLAVVVDAFGRDAYTVPPNVAVAANLYQRDPGFVRGSDTLTAEDPARTQIVGNWRYSYWGKDVPMPDEPPLRRWFMQSHLKMEYDPAPWIRVKELIRKALNVNSRFAER